MRKRIAILANGWGTEFLQKTGNGIYKRAKETDIDVFAFVNFSSFAGPEEDNTAEFSIFCLPDLKDFDGVVLMPNSFNTQKEVEFVFQQVKKAGIPAVSLEYVLPGIPYVGSENYPGMYELAKHMIEVHGVQNILFLAGMEKHPESQVRLKATMDAAREKRIKISNDNIIYGQWAAEPAKEELTTWAKSHNEMPDAIICANDVMAVAACQWLNERGYRVPQDVKVTGYDCLRDGQGYASVITSVTHQWDVMGEKAIDILIAGMQNLEMPNFTEINTAFVCGESCGCTPFEEGENGMRHRPIVEKRVDGLAVDQHFRHLYRDIRRDWTVEEVNKHLSDFIVREGWVEGEQFMLCLHPKFFSEKSVESIVLDDAFLDTVQVICNVQYKVAEKYRRMETSKAIFAFAEKNREAGCYICVPLSHDEKVRGFAILTRDFDVESDNLLYIWTRHINQCLEQIRANVKITVLNKKLENLSVTDMLTGVYNRTGCEKILYPFLEKCQKEGKRGMLMLVDVDKLKIINDIHGHVSGDLALCTAVEVLQEQLPGGYMIGRFGGDEFLVVGEVEKDDFSLENFATELMEAVGKTSDERKLEFPLSVSIGGILLDAGEEFVLDECLQRADDAMYAVKRRHHRKMEI